MFPNFGDIANIGERVSQFIEAVNARINIIEKKIDILITEHQKLIEAIEKEND